MAITAKSLLQGTPTTNIVPPQPQPLPSETGAAVLKNETTGELLQVYPNLQEAQEDFKVVYGGAESPTGPSGASTVASILSGTGVGAFQGSKIAGLSGAIAGAAIGALSGIASYQSAQDAAHKAFLNDPERVATSALEPVTDEMTGKTTFKVNKELLSKGNSLSGNYVQMTQEVPEGDVVSWGEDGRLKVNVSTAFANSDTYAELINDIKENYGALTKSLDDANDGKYLQELNNYISGMQSQYLYSQKAAANFEQQFPAATTKAIDIGINNQKIGLYEKDDFDKEYTLTVVEDGEYKTKTAQEVFDTIYKMGDNKIAKDEYMAKLAAIVVDPTVNADYKAVTQGVINAIYGASNRDKKNSKYAGMLEKDFWDYVGTNVPVAGLTVNEIIKAFSGGESYGDLKYFQDNEVWNTVTALGGAAVNVATSMVVMNGIEKGLRMLPGLSKLSNIAPQGAPTFGLKAAVVGFGFNAASDAIYEGLKYGVKSRAGEEWSMDNFWSDYLQDLAMDVVVSGASTAEARLALDRRGVDIMNTREAAEWVNKNSNISTVYDASGQPVIVLSAGDVIVDEVTHTGTIEVQEAKVTTEDATAPLKTSALSTVTEMRPSDPDQVPGTYELSQSLTKAVNTQISKQLQNKKARGVYQRLFDKNIALRELGYEATGITGDSGYLMKISENAQDIHALINIQTQDYMGGKLVPNAFEHWTSLLNGAQDLAGTTQRGLTNKLSKSDKSAFTPTQDNYLNARQEISRAVDNLKKKRITQEQYDTIVKFQNKWITPISKAESDKLDRVYDDLVRVSADIEKFRIAKELVAGDDAERLERFSDYIPLWADNSGRDTGTFVARSQWKKDTRTYRSENYLLSPETFQSPMTSVSQMLNKVLENAARSEQTKAFLKPIDEVPELGWTYAKDPENNEPLKHISASELLIKYEVPESAMKDIKKVADNPSRYKRAIDKLDRDNHITDNIEEYTKAREAYRSESMIQSKVENSSIVSLEDISSVDSGVLLYDDYNYSELYDVINDFLMPSYSSIGGTRVDKTLQNVVNNHLSNAATLYRGNLKNDKSRFGGEKKKSYLQFYTSGEDAYDVALIYAGDEASNVVQKNLDNQRILNATDHDGLFILQDILNNSPNKKLQEIAERIVQLPYGEDQVIVDYNAINDIAKNSIDSENTDVNIGKAFVEALQSYGLDGVEVRPVNYNNRGIGGKGERIIDVNIPTGYNEVILFGALNDGKKPKIQLNKKQKILQQELSKIDLDREKAIEKLVGNTEKIAEINNLLKDKQQKFLEMEGDPLLGKQVGIYKEGMTLDQMNAVFLDNMSLSIEGILNDAAKSERKKGFPALRPEEAYTKTMTVLKEAVQEVEFQPDKVTALMADLVKKARPYHSEKTMSVEWIKHNSDSYIQEKLADPELAAGNKVFDMDTNELVTSKPEGYPVQFYAGGKRTTVYIDGVDEAHKQLAKEASEILNMPISYQQKTAFMKLLTGMARLKRNTITALDPTRALPNLFRDQPRAAVSSGGIYLAQKDLLKLMAEVAGDFGYTKEQISAAYADIDRIHAQNAGLTQESLIRGGGMDALQSALQSANAPRPISSEFKANASMLQRTTMALKHQFDVYAYDVKNIGKGGMSRLLTRLGETIETNTRNRAADSAYAAKFIESLNNGKSFEEATADAFTAGSWAGRNNTTSFGTKGAWTEAAARYAPYSFSSFSSRASQIESFAADPLGVSVHFVAFLMGYTMSLASILADEESRKNYLNLDDYTRSNNILIPIDSGAIITIPMDDELAGYVSSIRMLLEGLSTQAPTSFWTVIGAFADMSSFDLSGFTEGDKFNLWRGLQRGASSYAPSLLTAIGEVATGTDWYYGSQLSVDDAYLAAYGQVADSAGDYTTQSNNSKTLHEVSDVLNIPQWMVQQFVESIGGNVGQYALYVLDKLRGATEEFKDLGGRDPVMAAVKPFTGADAQNIKSTFFNGITELKADKEKLVLKLASNKKAQTTATGNELTKLQQEHTKLIQDFVTHAGQWVNQYLTIFEMTGGLSHSEAMQVYYLFDFSDDTQGATFSVGTAGDYYANKFGTQEYYQQVSNAAGILDQYYDQTGRLYKAADGTFQPATTYGQRAVQNSQYNKGATYTAGLNALIQKSELKDGLDEVYAARNKIYDKGQLSKADYAELDRIAEEWDAKVTKVLLPYFRQYGMDPLASSQVVDYLDNYYIVPSSYMVNNQGKFIGASRLNKQRGFAKSYIQSVLTKLGVK